jgi:cyclopropane fatty-acyl-phospholipid synthase-like methyltransferase
MEMNFKKFIVITFMKPKGLLGGLAGFIMAHRSSNIERSRWTVSLLDLQPEHRILEIGYGPGVAIQMVAELVTDGLVMGIDHSQVMHRQASRRNAGGIRSGRIQLLHGDVSLVSGIDESFDRIFAVNVSPFWKAESNILSDIRDRLASGGKLVLTVQPRLKGASSEKARAIGEEIANKLQQAGFQQVEVDFLDLKPVGAVGLIATK